MESEQVKTTRSENMLGSLVTIAIRQRKDGARPEEVRHFLRGILAGHGGFTSIEVAELTDAAVRIAGEHVA